MPQRDTTGLTSLAVSTVLHVAALLIMAMIVHRALPEAPPPAIDVDTAPEPEFEDLAEIAIEPFEEPPRPEAVEAVIVESAPPAPDPGDAGALDPVAVSEETTPAAWDDLADALLAGIGNATPAGQGDGPGDRFGGFGGDVGRRLARAGAQTGDIQVSLSWNNVNDLDLHVLTPGKERIFFAHRASACRGQLDVDMNAGGPLSAEPVENVFWPPKRAPFGRFHVFVHHFANHGAADPTPFEVHVLVNGRRQTFAGTVSFGQAPLEVASFDRDASSTIGGDPADDFRE